MERYFKIIACFAIMLVSCEANVNEGMQELDLKEQLIGLEKVHNARQLGGYRIGKKTIKDNLLLRTAKLSEMTGADSTLLSDNYKVQCIYDFRGKDEAVSDPDVIPGNARYLSLSLSFTEGKVKSLFS